MLRHLLGFIDVMLAVYFVAGNGTYTFLMLVSLAAVWLHRRRRSYEGLEELRNSPATPPVTIVIPALNEQESIVDAVRSVLRTDYPAIQVTVVDDGSSDETLDRLTAAFRLEPAGLIARPRLRTRAVRGYFTSLVHPNLLVIRKARGGKPDALNAGLNMCRTPYFCTLDSDCILERDALLRLMRPVIRSPQLAVASGGTVRVLNGCRVENGQVTSVDLPRTGLERFQVVEYLRSFLFGRTGWNLLGATLIISGAFAVFHLETVIEAGGFEMDTVAEDMELVVRLRRWAVEHGRSVQTFFASDPVCWAQCPSSLRMLGRQRRRWQLGLCQTLRKHAVMFLNPAYGTVGWTSFPFHLFVEACGALVEPLGYLIIPLEALYAPAKLHFLLPLLLFSLAYSGLISVGAVALEDLTHCRYPKARQLAILLAYALLENFGYRQLLLWYRLQAMVLFFTGSRHWERVIHPAAAGQVEGARETL